MFSKADNYMKEGCFQSAFLCGKYPYIGDLYLQNLLVLLYFLLNTVAAILVKVLPDATFSGIPMTASFLCERIANIYTNSSFISFSGRFDVQF